MPGLGRGTWPEEATVWMVGLAQLGLQAACPLDVPHTRGPTQLLLPQASSEACPNLTGQGQKQSNTKDGVLATCSGDRALGETTMCVKGHFPGICPLAFT